MAADLDWPGNLRKLYAQLATAPAGSVDDGLSVNRAIIDALLNEEFTYLRNFEEILIEEAFAAFWRWLKANRAEQLSALRAAYAAVNRTLPAYLEELPPVVPPQEPAAPVDTRASDDDGDGKAGASSAGSAGSSDAKEARAEAAVPAAAAAQNNQLWARFLRIAPRLLLAADIMATTVVAASYVYQAYSGAMQAALEPMPFRSIVMPAGIAGCRPADALGYVPVGDMRAVLQLIATMLGAPDAPSTGPIGELALGAIARLANSTAPQAVQQVYNSVCIYIAAGHTADPAAFEAIWGSFFRGSLGARMARCKGTPRARAQRVVPPRVWLAATHDYVVALLSGAGAKQCDVKHSALMATWDVAHK